MFRFRVCSSKEGGEKFAFVGRWTCFFSVGSNKAGDSRVCPLVSFILCDRVSVSPAPPPVGSPPPPLAKACFPWRRRTCRDPTTLPRSRRSPCSCRGCASSLCKSRNNFRVNSLKREKFLPLFNLNSQRNYLDLGVVDSAAVCAPEVCPSRCELGPT